MDRYADIAAAVIEQAARDYYKLVSEYPNCKPTALKKRKRRIKEIVKFFRSQWYNELSYLCNFKIGGVQLMKILNSNIKNHVSMGKKEYV